MDRGIWEGTVHGVARVGHKATKTKKKLSVWVSFMYILNFYNFFLKKFQTLHTFMYMPCEKSQKNT